MDFVSLADEELLACAKQGHVEALGLLLFRLQPDVSRVLASQVGVELRVTISPDDALQETYRKAFSDFQSFRGETIEEFSAWVRQIGINQIRQFGRNANAKKRGGEFQRVSDADEFRSRAEGLLEQISTGDATVSQFVARSEAIDALRVALASLSEDQQTAVRLRFFEQLSVSEVAKRLDRSEGSVRGLLQRAKEQLRSAMHYSTLWLSTRK